MNAQKFQVLMKLEPRIILKLFLNFSDSEPLHSYKLYFYKRKSVYIIFTELIYRIMVYFHAVTNNTTISVKYLNSCGYLLGYNPFWGLRYVVICYDTVGFQIFLSNENDISSLRITKPNESTTSSHQVPMLHEEKRVKRDSLNDLIAEPFTQCKTRQQTAACSFSLGNPLWRNTSMMVKNIGVAKLSNRSYVVR